MGKEWGGLDRITAAMQQPLRSYAELVRKLAGTNAKALTLFGAVAADSFDPSRHTVRNVLVVDRVDLSMLRKLADHGAKLGKARIAAPLVMTPAISTRFSHRP